MTNTEIQVGEYVRTKDGCIEKVTQIDELYIDEEGEIEIVVGCDIEGALVYDKITKHSFNLIDLIEVDDYVNGMQVVEKYENSFAFEYEGQLFGNKQIKTIVTKEQFQSMEYEVREDD